MPGPTEKTFSTPFGEEYEIWRDNLVVTLPILKKEWKLSFEFKADKIEDRLKQLLHMTVGGKGAGPNAQYGDRTPAIWVSSSKGFLITSAVGGKPSFAEYFTPPPKPGDWAKIEVGQELIGSDFFYNINTTISGYLSMFSNKNSMPSEFENVKLFASSPWYQPASGVIKNLQIWFQGEGGSFQLYYLIDHTSRLVSWSSCFVV